MVNKFLDVVPVFIGPFGISIDFSVFRGFLDKLRIFWTEIFVEFVETLNFQANFIDK